MVCEHFIRKGRSSSRQLNSVLQRALGLRLVHGLEPLPMWVPSATNPADDPTRGVKIRKATPMNASMEEQWLRAMQGSEWPTVVTRQQWHQLGVDLQHFHDVRSPISHGTWSLAAVQYHHPATSATFPEPG
eukprot:1417899-Amphidinium_carterae.2